MLGVAYGGHFDGRWARQFIEEASSLNLEILLIFRSLLHYTKAVTYSALPGRDATAEYTTTKVMPDAVTAFSRP